MVSAHSVPVGQHTFTLTIQTQGEAHVLDFSSVQNAFRGHHHRPSHWREQIHDTCQHTPPKYRVGCTFDRRRQSERQSLHAPFTSNRKSKINFLCLNSVVRGSSALAKSDGRFFWIFAPISRQHVRRPRQRVPTKLQVFKCIYLFFFVRCDFFSSILCLVRFDAWSSPQINLIRFCFCFFFTCRLVFIWMSLSNVRPSKARILSEYKWYGGAAVCVRKPKKSEQNKFVSRKWSSGVGWPIPSIKCIPLLGLLLSFRGQANPKQ